MFSAPQEDRGEIKEGNLEEFMKNFKIISRQLTVFFLIAAWTKVKEKG